MNDIINISNQDGVLTVSSREVAANFKKRHSDVLDKIVNLSIQINSAEKSAQYLKQIQPTEKSARYSTQSQPAEKSSRYFMLSDYRDEKGEMRKEYLLTRDGFSLLVMGFTGKRALEWKLKYIDAFNLMEQKLIEAARAIEHYEAKSTSVGEVANLLKVLKSAMEKQGSAPNEVAEMASVICEQFNIKLPQNFVRKIKTRKEIYLDDPFVRERHEQKEREFLIWGFNYREY